MIWKKVKVSLRLFDIFERNRVFIFLCGSWESPPTDWASNEIDRVSKFDNSLSFDAKQNALQQIFFALWFFKDLFMKIVNWIFFPFFMILSRIKKGVYLCLFEHANTTKHVYEHCCSSVRRILAHLAHLAQFLFFIFNVINE